MKNNNVEFYNSARLIKKYKLKPAAVGPRCPAFPT